MIRVPFVDLEYPEDWLEERDSAQEAIEACLDTGSRQKLLRANSSADVWKGIRENLAKISHGKCWYCETLLTRDDLIVDHYRPKGRIFEESKDSEGYWWLAFQEHNFRLSCKYCNELRDDKVGGTRGGKATHFPLLEGSIRATAEQRDLSKEYPVILDPIVATDADCLVFLADAKAWPRYAQDSDTVAFLRAEQTICILHLNHGRLRKGRGQVCNQVAEAIERCDLAYRMYLERRASANDVMTAALARQLYEDAIQRLADFLKDSSPYAGAARSVVRQARGSEGREWVDVLL
jgi:5-methylcytosine-specific restriction endonuclease McrA